MAEQWSAGEERHTHQPHQLAPEPEPQPEAELLPETRRTGTRTGLIMGAIVAIALLAGAGYSTGWFASGSNPAPASVAVSTTAPVQSQGFSLLQQVTPADQAFALQALVMNDADKGAAAKAVQSGAVRLAWLAFSDSGTEDGDIVTITGAGFGQTVPLLKKETRLAVPYTPGTPIKVFAKKDGFAPGVTVAVYVGGNVFKLKTMKEGETIEIAAP
jgi:hypothetical protein